MKRLFLFVLFVGSVFLNPLASAAVVTLYDIDFSSPTHTVGASPSIGTGIDQISSIPFRNPTVESIFGLTANQSLHFDASRSTYEQIGLTMGQGYSNYQLSFDIFTSNLSGSMYAFTLLADTPEVRNFTFHGNGSVQHWIPGQLSLNSRYNDNTQYNVLIDYDLSLGRASSWLNGVLLGTQDFTTSGTDIEEFRFSLSRWYAGNALDPSVRVDLDNILVTTRVADVPEPNALLILSLGLIGLISVRGVARVGQGPA